MEASRAPVDLGLLDTKVYIKECSILSPPYVHALDEEIEESFMRKIRVDVIIRVVNENVL